MAVFTRVNGGVAAMEQVGRDLFFKTFSKTNITTAELEALVQTVQSTSTITAIGFGGVAFSTGVTDAVNMIIEGADITANVSAGGTTFVTTDMAF